MSELDLAVSIISIAITVLSLIFPVRDILFKIKIRNIRKVFGFKKDDKVIVVCSELSNPEIRQMVEEREFIYLMKYGDLDAWVEFLLSMIRAFPKVNFEIRSSGEALSDRFTLEEHIALIGGPDYNKLTEHFIDKDKTRFSYTEINNEIALVDKQTGKKYYHTTLNGDYGYIEKIPNPHNPKKSVFIFGGCHTVGVTSAVNFFSVFSNGKSKVSSVALMNAKYIKKHKDINSREFALLINAVKVGSTISYPGVSDIVEID